MNSSQLIGSDVGEAIAAIPAKPARPRRRLDPDAPAVDNIARIVGAGATTRLISTFGGSRVYIARSPGRLDAVARVIGAEAAGLLGTIFGGERIWLPNGSGHLSRRRIAMMRRRGSSVSRIARELRLSERYVYKVLAQLRNS